MAFILVDAVANAPGGKLAEVVMCRPAAALGAADEEEEEEVEEASGASAVKAGSALAANCERAAAAAARCRVAPSDGAAAGLGSSLATPGRVRASNGESAVSLLLAPCGMRRGANGVSDMARGSSGWRGRRTSPKRSAQTLDMQQAAAKR